MKDEKKTSFFKKIFGKKSSCCSLGIEEIDANEGKFSSSGDMTASCSCNSTPKTDVKKDEDGKE